ncbi:DinB family protein [Pelagibius sp.]|uniref:DinB family protein n=1 Tax=Pelagibius sp. TaxID=1931238 RepID=UPI003B513D99
MEPSRGGLILPGYLNEMAAYNAWQNGAVVGHLDALGEAERTAERGLFFGSLHRTFDHIATIDRWILDVVEGVGVRAIDLKELVFADWADLKAERARLDRRIDAVAARADQAWLDGVIEIESRSFGRTRRIPRGLYLVQMFNHQTHHRSQITGALWQMGINYGGTDIPFRPDSPY